MFPLWGNQYSTPRVSGFSSLDGGSTDNYQHSELRDVRPALSQRLFPGLGSSLTCLLPLVLSQSCEGNPLTSPELFFSMHLLPLWYFSPQILALSFSNLRIWLCDSGNCWALSGHSPCAAAWKLLPDGKLGIRLSSLSLSSLKGHSAVLPIV